jgi:Cu-processing system permease protein
MIKVFTYILLDVLRSRFVNGYLLVTLLLSFGLFYFTNDADKGILGMSNIILLLVPVVCIIFTSTTIYNSTDFFRLLLTQPVSRSTVYSGHFLALASALLYAFIVGAGVPLILYSAGDKIFPVMLSGIVLTLVFTSLSYLICTRINDKVKGIGASLFAWLYFVVIYDGLMLLVIRAMSEYPVEQYSMVLALLNPVDMCRILVMFSFDISALMGLTGTVLQNWLGTAGGQAVIYASLMLWILVPFLIARRIFLTKDF